MRLIDADATIKEIKARNPDDVSYEDAWAITCIEHAPTIEPDTDTISRQDAINLIERYCDNGCEIAEDKWCPDCQRSKFAEMIKALPPSPSRPQWIPCSERMPEDGRQVLVYAISVHFALAKYDEMRNADGIYSMQWVTFDAWKPFYTIKDVVAWMPLPEPYREGE